MSRLVIANDQVVRPVRQQVLVNGIWRQELFCDSVTKTLGRQATSAKFHIPTALWDDAVEWLRDAQVIVYAWHSDEDAPTVPLFVGYIQIQQAAFAAKANHQQFGARGILDLMSQVFVGQPFIGEDPLDGANRRGDVIYRKQDKWTLHAIAHDLFTADMLDANWREIVGLGNTAALDRLAMSSVDVRFSAQSYQQALWALCTLAGNVRMRERFLPSGKTLLDFVEFGDMALPTRRIVVPDATTGPSNGAIVTKIRKSGDTGDVCSRVVGFGRAKRYMVTTRTPDGILDPLSCLVPDWPEASPWLTDDADLTTDEKAVMANPTLATPGKPAYKTADAWRQFCFRLFQLPDVLKRMQREGKNIWRNSDGQEIRLQCFIEDYAGYEYDPEAGVDMRADGTFKYTLIEGWSITGDQGFQVTGEGVLVLPRPALRLYEQRPDSDNGAVVEFRRAPVFLTITVQDREKRPYYDTNVRGDLQYPIIQDSGIVEAFINDGVYLDVVGTATDELMDSEGNSFTFGAIWFDEMSKSWESTPAGTPITVRNDGKFMAEICERSLAERTQRRTTIISELPKLALGADVLDRLIVGADNLQVSRVDWELDTMSTTIEASDTLPTMVDGSRLKPFGTAATPTTRGQAIDSVRNMPLGLAKQTLPGLWNFADMAGITGSKDDGPLKSQSFEEQFPSPQWKE